jgi:hypothetical protein
MKEQEYLYNGEYVTIVDPIGDSDDLVCVSNDHDELIVARRSNLTKKEDSYGFKKAEERRKELNDITAQAEANLDKVVEKVIEKAVASLSTRMKLNAVFGKDIGTAGGWALMVSDELTKLIKEEAPKIVKKDDIFDT